jgi:methionyl-tRNA formyltransferase
MRIAFIGTAAFAVPALHALARAGHTIPLVVTQPDRPAGRGLKLSPPPVKQAAWDLKLSIFQPARIRDEDAIARLRSERPDAIVVVAYGQILPETLLHLTRLGALNVHASLLPRHRGAAPIQRAILAGDTQTGVTIMQMDAGVDTGPILAVERIAIAERETAAGLEVRLAALGAELLVWALEALVSGAIAPIPQPDAGATYAPKIRPEEGRLRLDMPAVEIDRRVRALTPDPGCRLTLPQGEIKVLAGHLPAGGGKGGVPLQTADGTYIVEEVQPASGRRMSAEAWLRGRR